MLIQVDIRYDRHIRGLHRKYHYYLRVIWPGSNIFKIGTGVIKKKWHQHNRLNLYLSKNDLGIIKYNKPWIVTIHCLCIISYDGTFWKRHDLLHGTNSSQYLGRTRMFLVPTRVLERVPNSTKVQLVKSSRSSYIPWVLYYQ